MTNTADRDAVVSALSEYLRRNPEACDTLDGIARWWLGGEGRQRTALVQEALDRLEELGVIERVQAGDGRVRYRRRADGDSATHAAPRRHGRRGRGVH
jgi:Fe2+ or Zn2+ uptake regulation protein